MVNAVVGILINGHQNRDFKMRFDTNIDYMFHAMLYEQLNMFNLIIFPSNEEGLQTEQPLQRRS